MYRLSRLPWPLILAALALGCGIYGFLQVPGMDAYSAALNTAQLFVLNLPADQLPNWYARAAGVLGPLSAVTAAILGFTEVIQHWFWRIDYRYRPPQYVFLGGGRAAAARLRHLQGQHGRPRILCIDSHADCPVALEKGTDKSNVRMLVTDAADRRLLRDYNVHSAPHVLVSGGSDAATREMLFALEGARSLAGNRAAPAVWLVELADSARIREFDMHFRSEAFENVGETKPRKTTSLRVDFFSAEKIGAREILRKHGCHAVRSGKRPHIAVVGNGEYAQAIVFYAIHHLVTSDLPENCLVISWICSNPSEMASRVRLVHPLLGLATDSSPLLDGLLPLVEFRWVQAEPGALDPTAWTSLTRVDGPGVFFVACGDGLKEGAVTRNLLALKDVLPFEGEPVIVECRNEFEAKSESMVQSAAPKKAEGYALANLFDELWHEPKTSNPLVSADNAYPGAVSDVDARKVHESFDKENPWNSLHEWKRWSSRLSADHWVLNQQLNGSIEDVGLRLDRLARLEHRRFIVERLMDGWLPDHLPLGKSRASGYNEKSRRDLLRINSTLVPYDRLPPTRRNELRLTAAIFLPEFATYQAVGVCREVEFAVGPLTVATREGLVSALTGDAIVTGEQGERWPVKRSEFEKLYVPETAGLEFGQAGTYRKVVAECRAKRMNAPFRVTIEGGVLEGKAGDWIVVNSQSSLAVVAGDTFGATYRPLAAGIHS